MGNSTFTILGGVAGGAAGFWMGGPSGAATGFSIGSSIGGGIDARNIAYNNASNVYAMGQYNAAHTIAIGNYNASVIGATAVVNASLTAAGAVLGAQATTMVSMYNANLKLMMSNYNASLLEDEAELVWQAAELDVFQHRKAMEVVEGSARAAYGASGVLVDVATDTPSQALLDIETERELDVFIMRHNADIQAGKLLDAAAHTRWEGEQFAKQILFEGFTSSNLQMGQAMLGVVGELAGAGLRQNQIQWTSQMEANRIMTEAYYGAQNFKASGDQSLINGLLDGAKFYGQYKLATAAPKAGTPTPTPKSSKSPLLPKAGQKFGPGSSLLIPDQF